MKAHRETVVAFVGALLLASTVAAQQPPPLTKFVTPLKGEVQVDAGPSGQV